MSEAKVAVRELERRFVQTEQGSRFELELVVGGVRAGAIYAVHDGQLGHSELVCPGMTEEAKHAAMAYLNAQRLSLSAELDSRLHEQHSDSE